MADLAAYVFLLLLVLYIFQQMTIPALKYFGIISAKLDEVQIQNLSKYSPYYRKLKSKHKKEFRQRVALFIESKEFLSREMDAVTEEMKLVVASFAIQLTFGLPKVYLAHFRKILIYPNDYYSTINKTYHKGEVNPRFGMIVLSWKHLIQGIAEEEDGINLGLHEMAHAIHLENRISNEEYGFLDEKLWSEYAELAHYETFKIQDGQDSIFRPGAATDHYEFFAILIETFFEKPIALKAYSASLYKVTCLLLKQDPLKLSGI